MPPYHQHHELFIHPGSALKKDHKTSPTIAEPCENSDMILIKLLFWSSFALMGYVYFLYPVMITSLSKYLNKRFSKGDIEPPVSIIITAYNEERGIVSKIENTLSLDYPKHKMEIIVGSDGSTDRTNEIVRSYENQGVRLMGYAHNRGKTMTQNDCVRNASYEIIIFMDASSLCDTNCIRRLVANLSDPRVGAVAGRVEFIQSFDNLTTQSQGIYWKYEQMLKTAESKMGTLVGVDGPLYAIRKELYVQLSQDIISDLITPLLIIRDGYSVVYESDAVTYEEATKQTADEIKTRRRIVSRGFYGLTRYPELFNLLHRPLIAWEIISHKILRWLVGLYFVVMLVCSLVLIVNFGYLIMFIGIVTFLCLAYQGFKSQDHCRKICAIPYYFVLVNWAAILGVLDFLRGKKVISWKPVR
jgi:cellulose synthase/poly-beta-1,6-N-acetylglucosamine synthase-like glycosyltransferase